MVDFYNLVVVGAVFYVVGALVVFVVVVVVLDEVFNLLEENI